MGLLGGEGRANPDRQELHVLCIASCLTGTSGNSREGVSGMASS